MATSIDRREFLQGVVAAFAATQIPPVVEGLEFYETQFLFPDPAIPGTEFEVRLSGSKQVAWPSRIQWPGGVPIPPSGGMDIFRFFTPDTGDTWYGMAVLDLR